MIIKTKQAPEAIGPYSQAIKINNMLFISGQIPINPTTGEIVGSDIKTQTKQVMTNLNAIIEAANMSLKNIVKCSCFIKDLNGFTLFNEAYKEYMQDIYPARECVEVSRLPKDVMIEISAICVN